MEWTKQEESFLIKNLETLSNKEIALALNRSVPSVKFKLRTTGLTRSKELNFFQEIENEEWIEINDTYSISNLGRVRNDKTLVIRKTCLNSDGYERVTIIGNIASAIHVLVAKAFIPNPEKLPEVNHKDGIKTNNVYTNLEWCTEEYNLKHALELGLRNTLGSNSPLAKMSEQDAVTICELISLGKTSTEIIKQVGSHVTKSMINGISSGRRWKHISCNYKLRKKTSLIAGTT
jgi:hypothetical protein